MWYWHKNRHVDQWRRIGSPEINPYTYNESQQRRQEYTTGNSLFSNWCWESRSATCKSTKLGCFLTSYMKIKSKHLKDLKIRHGTIKLLEEIIGKTPSEIKCTNVLQVSQGNINKNKNKQTGSNKLTSFYTAKEIINQRKRQPKEWGKYLQMMQLIRALILKIYKQLIQLNNKQANNPIRKRAEVLSRHFSKKGIQMATRHLKRYSTALITRKMQIKTTMKYHLTSVRRSSI